MFATKYYYRVVLVALVFAGLLSNQVLLADRSLLVGPSRFDLSLSPGDEDTYVIRVNNDGTDKLLVETLLENLYVREDGTPYYGPASDDVHSCAKWIRVSPQQFDLAPGQTQVVRFNLRVPETALGSHYAVVFFRTLSALKGNNAIGVSSKIGTIVVLDVQGTAPIVGDLVGLNVIPPHTATDDVSLVYQASLLMKNAGMAQFKVSGNIYLQDEKNQRVFENHFDPITVVPEVTRNILIDGPTTLNAGAYTLKAEVEYQNEIIEGEHRFTVR